MTLLFLKIHKSKILFNRITEGAFLKAQKESGIILVVSCMGEEGKRWQQAVAEKKEEREYWIEDQIV